MKYSTCLLFTTCRNLSLKNNTVKIIDLDICLIPACKRFKNLQCTPLLTHRFPFIKFRPKMCKLLVLNQENPIKQNLILSESFGEEFIGNFEKVLTGSVGMDWNIFPFWGRVIEIILGVVRNIKPWAHIGGVSERSSAALKIVCKLFSDSSTDCYWDTAGCQGLLQI